VKLFAVRRFYVGQ